MKKKNWFLLSSVILMATLLIIIYYPKDKLLMPVGDPLSVNVLNERTDETEIRYVQIYKTVVKLTASEMYEAVPGNWWGSHMSFFHQINKNLEVPRGAFYKQHPEYRNFYTFEMGQINGHTNVGMKELLMIEQWFSDGQLHINRFYDIYDSGNLFSKGTIVILGCKK